MSDGLTTQSSTLATVPASSKIATDDCGAPGHVQIVKLAVSTDGDATLLATLPVSAASLPLPTGAATSALQTTGNASLSSIDGKITAVNTGAVVVSSSALPTGASTGAKQDTGNTSLSSIDGKITAVNTGAVVVSSSALPTGASTSALQTTGNSSLSSIDGKLTAGHGTAAAAVRVELPTDGTGVVSAKNLDGSGNALTSATRGSERALSVQIVDNTGAQVTTFGGSGGTASNFGSAFPTAGTAIGFKDSAGTNLAAGNLDASGFLKVNVAAGGTSGTQYVGDAAATSTPTGTVGMGLANSAAPSDVSANNDAVAVWALRNGSQVVNLASGGTLITAGQTTMAASLPVALASNQSALPITDNSGSLTVDNAGTFATQDSEKIVDNAGFTDGTSKVQPAGYIFDEVAGTALSENDAAAARIDSKRAQIGVLEDATTRGQRAAVSAAGALASNITQVAGATIAQGHGTAATALRVELPTDGTGIVGLAAGANTIGALTANQSVNNAQINGVTPLMGNGASGTGAQRVTIANDSTGILAGVTTVSTVTTLSSLTGGGIAHDGADSGNPIKVGGRARSTDVTAVSSDDRSDLILSLLGKQVVLPYALPGSTWSYSAAAGGLVTTAGVTVKASAGAGIRNYISSVQVINSHQTIGTEIVINDGASGTALWRGWAQPAGGGASVKFDPPLRGSTATLVEIAEVTATATAGVLVSVQGFTAGE